MYSNSLMLLFSISIKSNNSVKELLLSPILIMYYQQQLQFSFVAYNTTVLLVFFDFLTNFFMQTPPFFLS